MPGNDTPGEFLEGEDVGFAGVVHLVVADGVFAVETEIPLWLAGPVEQRIEVVVAGVRLTVHQDGNDRRAVAGVDPLKRVLVLGLRERKTTVLIAGIDRDDGDSFGRPPDLQRFNIGTGARIIGEDASVDQGLRAFLGQIFDLGRLEIGWGCGCRPGRLTKDAVVWGFASWLPGVGHENRSAVGDIVGGDHDVGKRFREGRRSEVAFEQGLKFVGVVFLLYRRAQIEEALADPSDTFLREV